MSMYERFNNYTTKRPRTRKVFGWFLVVVGFIALVTPLTPGGILFFVGLEILGLKILGSAFVQRFFGRYFQPQETSIPRESTTPLH
jgi:hypothetical protein